MAKRRRPRSDDPSNVFRRREHEMAFVSSFLNIADHSRLTATAPRVDAPFRKRIQSAMPDGVNVYDFLRQCRHTRDFDQSTDEMTKADEYFRSKMDKVDLECYEEFMLYEDCDYCQHESVSYMVCDGEIVCQDCFESSSRFMYEDFRSLHDGRI